MGEEKWLVPELHEGAVPKLGQKGNEGLARPGKQGQDFQRLESKFAVWGNQGDMNVAKVQAGAGAKGDEIEKVDM